MALPAGRYGVTKNQLLKIKKLPMNTIKLIEELTESKADNSVIGTVEDGTNPTKAYAVGEHMVRGGKFCTVTVAVTTSSTWTLGSNYVEGSVGDYICKCYKNSLTVSANGSSDFNIPTITGYNPFTVTAHTSGIGASMYFYTECNSTNGVIDKVKIRNHDSSERTWMIYINVLYVKADTVVVEAIS